MTEKTLLNDDIKGIILIIGGLVLLLNTLGLLELWTDRIVTILAVGIMLYGFLLARGPYRLIKWSRQLFNR